MLDNDREFIIRALISVIFYKAEETFLNSPNVKKEKK